MKELYLENVRCFHGPTKIPLAPLTLLVGENSAGKSTALACVRLAWDLFRGLTGPNFNEEPFLLGSYEHLAHFHGGQGQRAKSFTIGAAFDGGSEYRGEFMSDGGQPVLSRWVTTIDGTECDVTFFGERAGQVVITHKGIINRFVNPHITAIGGRAAPGGMGWLLSMIIRTPKPKDAAGSVELVPSQTDREVMEKLIRVHFPAAGAGRPHAVAPIRTTPLRTYEPTARLLSPDGKHAPTELADLYRSSKQESLRHRASLREFGEASGLFSEIRMRRLGNQKYDPFQVTLRVPGQKGDRNIVDVGYGVSQVLPVLVDTLRSQSPMTLFQQPEVHLHPRAQAELGTFFAHSASDSRQILIETHSDYLIDRIAMHVREGLLRPDQVLLVFFDRQPIGVDVHPIRLDEGGNVVGAPPCYREFFMHEQERILGA